LIKFVKTPSHSAHKRITNQAIRIIKSAGIAGIWYPEIAFKGDQPKAIDAKLIGYSESKQHLVHIHGIISISDKASLKSIFPIKKQAQVTEIGIGDYACMSLEQNLINVIRYSTKKDWKTEDIPVIEANEFGFAVKKS
jgi:hypothetical protein